MGLAMAIFERYTVGSEGLTLAAIVWRRFRRRVPGKVEATLEANRHLAGLPPVLPVGTAIDIPVDQPATTSVVKDRKTVRLWG